MVVYLFIISSNFDNDYYAAASVFGAESFQFTASSSSATIEIDSVSTHGFLLDNFVVTAVPKPMTMALLGLGGLFLRRKKR
jgi:MYXO-CTERM domain-containing protein